MDTNRLDVRSLVGLFYMLLLAMTLALGIAGTERFFAAHPKLWQRLRRPYTPVAAAGAEDGLLHAPAALETDVITLPAAPYCSTAASGQLQTGRCSKTVLDDSAQVSGWQAGRATSYQRTCAGCRTTDSRSQRWRSAGHSGPVAEGDLPPEP